MRIFVLFTALAIISSVESAASQVELLVKWRGGPLTKAASDENARTGAEVLRNFEAVGWQLIRMPKGTETAAALRHFWTLPTVVAAEPNQAAIHFRLPEKRFPVNGGSSGLHTLSTSGTVLPNDPRFSEQWYHRRIGCPTAWAKTTGSSNVVVAVWDTGVDYNHPDLAPNM
jgi:subtilisin family serine protease